MVPSDHITKSTNHYHARFDFAKIELTLLVSVSIQLDVSLFSPSRCCLHLKSGLVYCGLGSNCESFFDLCSVGIDSSCTGGAVRPAVTHEFSH